MLRPSVKRPPLAAWSGLRSLSVCSMSTMKIRQERLTLLTPSPKKPCVCGSVPSTGHCSNFLPSPISISLIIRTGVLSESPSKIALLVVTEEHCARNLPGGNSIVLFTFSAPVKLAKKLTDVRAIPHRTDSSSPRPVWTIPAVKVYQHQIVGSSR